MRGPPRASSSSRQRRRTPAAHARARPSGLRPGRPSSAPAAAPTSRPREISGATAERTGSGRIAPTLVGRGGRVPPGEVVDDDTPDPGGEDPTAPAATSRRTAPLFDPREDGIDFYESLEGMLTEVRRAVAVAPTTDFGSNRELPVLADSGAGASVRAPRGPIVVRGFDTTAPQEFRRGDMNPERIILNDANDPRGCRSCRSPTWATASPAPVRAVVDYSFGNFKFLASTTRGSPTAGCGPSGRASATATSSRWPPTTSRTSTAPTTRRASTASPARSSATCARPTSSASRRSRTTTARRARRPRRRTSPTRG